MAMNAVLKFEGDIRAWQLNPTTGDKTPAIADNDDIFGNIPLEASATVFGYEAGESVDVTSKRRNRYGQTIYSEQEPGQSSLSLTLVAVPPALLARVFYGERAEVSVTSGEVASEEVTFAADAVTQQMANKYIASSPAPVDKNTAGDKTYVDGTDYVIDRRLGRIRRLTGGEIDATDTVKVTYTKTSYKLLRIRGGTKPSDTFYLHGDFKNRPDGSDMYLEIYQAELSTGGDVDLFSTQPITVELTGPLITPENKTEPYIVEVKSAA